MNTGKFLHLCVEKGISIIPYKDENLDQYKILTASFKYLCDFNKEGICEARTTSMCCCSSCACGVGYLKKIRDSANRINEYASKFDKTYGFWRHKIGCILPRELRSAICTGFVCGTTRSRFEHINGDIIMKFMKLLYNYNTLTSKKEKDLYKLYTIIRNEQ